MCGSSIMSFTRASCSSSIWCLGFAVPMFYIAAINLELLLAPIIFVICYVVVVRRYIRRLEPVMMQQRMQYGTLSARLEETISGIEIVKVAAQEIEERKKFRRNAWKFRDFFVQQGKIEAAYLPLLMFGIAYGFFFLHCLNMYSRGILSIGDIVAVAGLMQVISFPVFISLFSISMIQLGIAGARRILELIEQRSDIDENLGGHGAPVVGAIEFDHVTFKFHGSTVLGGRILHRRARANGRHSRADRLGQVHADPTGQPHLRCQ